MNRLKSVLVALDFSDRSQLALRQAIRLARWNQAELHLLHVIDKDTVDDLKSAVPDDRESLVADLVADAEAELRKLVPAELGLELETHVRVARPAAGIIDFCTERQPDLLVLGIRGHNTRDNRAGTQAMRVAKHAPVKTLLVHERAEGPFGHITVCTDFSRFSDEGLVQAIRIARQDESRVELLHAFTPPWQVLHYRGPSIGTDPDFQHQYRAGLTGRMKGAIEAHADGHPVEPVLVEARNHADGILEHSAKSGSDLIVIGNRGRSGIIERFLLGGTAERVIEEAGCSVLIVHVR